MSIVVEVHPQTTPNTAPHPLIKHLSPIFENLVKSEVSIIEIFLQLNQIENISDIRLPEFIKLTNKKSKAPITHNSYPVLYQKQEIGVLRLTHQISTNKNEQTKVHRHYRKVTKTLSLLLKRYQTTCLTNHYLGKELSLKGNSNTILALDSFIEKAASTFCPVIICGNLGSEKLTVASAIHYNSSLKHKPFIEINCSTPNIEEFKKNILQSLKQVNGGCIYFHAIDELSLPQQNLLTELLTVKFTKETTVPSIGNIFSIRMLVSATTKLEELVKTKKFSRDLYDKFNFLNIKIPNILQRKEDLPYILEKLIEKYRLFPEQELSIEAKQALYNYHWPRNHLEIEQTIARLLTLAATNPISLEDVQQHIPAILCQTTQSPVEQIPNNIIKRPNFDLISSMKTKNYPVFEHLHKGLQKALIFLAENYKNTLTLTTLAEQVFISPSHLSYLFKHTLKKTFKQILSELRIEEAKQIIATSPQRLITQVSLDVGFGDLSHFEKMFKRHTEMTPRQYKNMIKEQYLIPNT